MFTGIVEEVGIVDTVQRRVNSARLTVRAPRVAEDSAIGDSISVNGVCLTVVAREGSHLSFDAVPETLQRSNLRCLRTGDGVNLERALAVGQRLGGHFVQGHVDGTGVLQSVTERENARVLRISAGPELRRYMVPKGSVALDGISLTLVDVEAESFTVWIIPHTYAHTNLRTRRPGDLLNIEIDLLAKYVERLLFVREPKAGLSEEKLVDAGFIDSRANR
ncbi:MAG TPA: riboflavin synthase [Chthonomonadales bacterium]|nr:riboflavin synthase [Chthonomonadales bacterium]